MYSEQVDINSTNIINKWDCCHVGLKLNCKWKFRGLGMGIFENSNVRFGSRFCFYGSVLSRFPKRFINDISWIRNNAMECVAELA